MRSLPATVLAGFLGAGKNWPLNLVLANREALARAVFINDMNVRRWFAPALTQL